MTDTNPPARFMLGLTPAELAALAAPTDPSDAKTRPGPGGVTLTYVDARYVMDLLDKVCGPARWQDRYEPLNDNLTSSGVRCGIGILVDMGDRNEWVWKWDVGAESDIEDLKGAHSDAFKRAAVKWGIARDLYDERSPARVATAGAGRSAPRPTVRTTVTATGAAVTAAPAATVAPWDGQSPWACPLHNTVKVVLGTKWTGRQSRAGKDFGSFLGCTERSCSNTGPRVDENTAYSIHLGLDAGTVTVPGFTTLMTEPTDDDDRDGLPF